MKTRYFPPTPPRRARQWRQSAIVVLLALAFAGVLAGCALHSGGETVAYLHHGALWVSDADGTNAHLLASGPVLDFAWSPDHRELVYRQSTEHGTSTPGNGMGTTEVPSTLFIISVNGGTPIQNSSLDAYTRSAAWWDANGDHLLYAERVGGQPQFVVAQPDQPAAIASKLVPGTTLPPAPNADASQFAFLDAAGQVHIVPIGQPDSAASVVASGALLQLPGTARPAHLLWQPHANAVVYPAQAPEGVSLMRYDATSKTTTRLLTVPTLLDADFSPDGTLLLTRTPDAFEVWRLPQPAAPLLTLPDTHLSALPWWSPNSSHLLIADPGALRLVAVRAGASAQRIATLDSSAKRTPSAGWLPATSDPWSPSGSQIVYTQSGAAYARSVRADGGVGAPQRVAANVQAAVWSTADPSSALLQPVSLDG